MSEGAWPPLTWKVQVCNLTEKGFEISAQFSHRRGLKSFWSLCSLKIWSFQSDIGPTRSWVDVGPGVAARIPVAALTELLDELHGLLQVA